MVSVDRFRRLVVVLTTIVMLFGLGWFVTRRLRLLTSLIVLTAGAGRTVRLLALPQRSMPLDMTGTLSVL